MRIICGISFCNVANILLKGLIELIQTENSIQKHICTISAYELKIVMVFLKEEQWKECVSSVNVCLSR